MTIATIVKGKGTKKITVRFSYKLKSEMQQDIIKLGYGLHGKSRWICEAMQEFLSRADYLTIVDNGMGINQGELNSVEAFYVDADTIVLLRKAIMEIRQQYPLFEGVQSAIIRACAVSRLLGLKNSPRGNKS